MDVVEVMRAPFPWFGGKLRVAGEVRERFGEGGELSRAFCMVVSGIIREAREGRDRDGE